MKKSICGVDCSKCPFSENCKGCENTCGSPFGGKCVVAECCKNKHCKDFGKLQNSPCQLKAQIIDEFNSLNIAEMPKVMELYSLNGSLVNMEYILSNGQKIKFLNDSDVYLGNQLAKDDGKTFFGIVANEQFLLISEYGENGANPKLTLFKKR